LCDAQYKVEQDIPKGKANKDFFKLRNVNELTQTLIILCAENNVGAELPKPYKSCMLEP
jgi:hypothetical protein